MFEAKVNTFPTKIRGEDFASCYHILVENISLFNNQMFRKYMEIKSGQLILGIALNCVNLFLFFVWFSISNTENKPQLLIPSRRTKKKCRFKQAVINDRLSTDKLRKKHL